MVSIALFTIILFFIYQSLQVTQVSRDMFNKKVNFYLNEKIIKEQILEDILESFDSIGLEKLKDNNYLVRFKTTNNIHNPFYEHITYLVSKEKNLMRIESLTAFDSKKINDHFFDTAYIDILAQDIKLFEVSSLKDNKDAFSFLLKKEDATLLFNVLRQ